MARIWIGSDVDGYEDEAEQLATFTHYVKGSQFRFIVTRYASEVSVTHRLTGLRICAPTQIVSALGDYAAAGKAAVQSLINTKGADRVHDVLTRAEQKGYGLMGGVSA